MRTCSFSLGLSTRTRSTDLAVLMLTFFMEQLAVQFGTVSKQMDSDPFTF